MRDAAPSQTELARRCFSEAKGYAQLYEGSPSPQALFFNERLQRVFELIAPVKSGKVLEVGCGPGILLSRLAGPQLELFGLDLSPEMIAEAKSRTAGLDVELAVGQLAQLPYRDQSFDMILALGVLEYLPDQRTALSELARVAKPDAIIIISMLNKVSLYRWWEHFVYRRWSTLKSLIRSQRPDEGPKMWLHSRRSLIRAMKACQLAPVEFVYYDPNVCVPPLDSKYHPQASALNRRVKDYCGRWISPLLHTAFLVRALSKPDLN